MTYQKFRKIILELQSEKVNEPKYFLWNESKSCNEFDFTFKAIQTLEKLISNGKTENKEILSFWFYELDCGKKWKESCKGFYPKTLKQVWDYYKGGEIK